MMTHNTLSSVILRDNCAYASDFHWRGLEESKTIPVKAQIQSSQAAEFSSKAGNRWMGTAAGGAATSVEKLPRPVLHTRTVLLLCTGPQLCTSAWMVPQPLQLRAMPFWKEPAWHFFPALYACLFPEFAHCSRRKVHQILYLCF